MDFGLSSEQLALTDSVSRFLATELDVDGLRTFTDSKDYSSLWRGLVELGLPGLVVNESAGGIGLKLIDAALIAECLGRAAAPSPFLASAVIAPLALADAEPELRERITAKLLDGSYSAGLAISELAGTRGGAGVVATGSKLSGLAQFVIDVDADVLIVASSEGQIYLVESTAEGLSQSVQTTIDRTRISGELRFSNTPATLLTDDRYAGLHLLDTARVMLAADTVGAAQYMLDSAVAYANTREQFGRVIGSFQAVKHLCAEMAAALEPCRAMMWYAAHALSELPDEARLTACHTKAHIAEVGTFVARTATEVHGGVGFTDLLGLHYWFKRIGFNRQALGAPELVRAEASRLQGWA